MTEISTPDIIEDCLICLEPLTKRLLLPCNHSPTCVKCFITYNSCYGKRICPFCQREVNSDPIVTDSLSNSTYEEELQKGYKHDNQFHIFYKDQSVIDELKSFQQYQCKKCNETFKNFYLLNKHLKTHKMTTCKICHNSKRFLPSQTPQFTQNEIKRHLHQHPKCPVCPFTAFDQCQLNEHMRENHFRCEICADQGKILWFPNLDLLQVHLHTHHYACEDPMCVQQGVIAFATEFELQMHQIKVHGAKIPLTVDFKDNEAEQNEVDYKSEHRRRITLAKKKLGQTLRNVLHNQKDVQSVFDSLQDLQTQKISVKQFLTQLNQVCQKSTDAVFCDVVAAIGNARIRASVIKERQGINQNNDQNCHKQNYPTINTNAENPHNHTCKCCRSSDDDDNNNSNANQKTVNSNNAGGKKKAKKIVISSF